MAAHVRVVQVPDAVRGELQRRARDKGAPARVVERARIVLLAAEEVPGKQIAALAGDGYEAWVAGVDPATREPRGCPVPVLMEAQST